MMTKPSLEQNSLSPDNLETNIGLGNRVKQRKGISDVNEEENSIFNSGKKKRKHSSPCGGNSQSGGVLFRVPEK